MVSSADLVRWSGKYQHTQILQENRIRLMIPEKPPDSGGFIIFGLTGFAQKAQTAAGKHAADANGIENARQWAAVIQVGFKLLADLDAT